METNNSCIDIKVLWLQGTHPYLKQEEISVIFCFFFFFFFILKLHRIQVNRPILSLLFILLLTIITNTSQSFEFVYPKMSG